MMHSVTSLFLICFFCNALLAQTDANGTVRSERYVSPADASLRQDIAEVDYFASQLEQLKAAYAANNVSAMIVRESAVIMALRNEINQLELKLAENTVQAERRKSAGSGQINAAIPSTEAPARDPFAEATTPDEIRFETMKNTLAAFERHSFDPGKPDDAARDFAKLDNVLKIMREALVAGQPIRQ